ncbi:MAG: RsmD family RNA methyltransferase [Planctomycetota bacterium]
MSRRRSRRTNQRIPRVARPAGTLRVIGGRFRGKQIQYLGDPRTRPMKQRVREAAFNLLGEQVVGSHVLDLFAGTGALTWEAFSRGAVSATLLERHFPSVKILHANAAALGVTEQIEVEATDSFFWSRKLTRQACTLPADRRWIVFCSPPYDFYVTKLDAMLKLIQQVVHAAPPRSLMLVESDRRLQPECLPSEVSWDVREYAPAVLALAKIDSTMQ